jgi:hypothetical protein
VAVSDEFAAEIQRPPFFCFWIGPEIARRIVGGVSPVLSSRQFQMANARGGLNIIAWPSGPSLEDMARMDINHLYMGAFVETVRGHRIKQAFFQTSVVEEINAVVQWGAAVATADGLQPDLSKLDLKLLTEQPVVLVMNESLASTRFGSWASTLFVVSAPQIGFSRAQQRLLSDALRGLTDEELSVELQVSLSAIKKTWRSIYSRVEHAGLPILPALPETREDGDRGKGKRHRLLNYVREHPEELRPFSMKLLRQSRASATEGQPATPALPRRRVGRRRSNSSSAD